MVEETLTYQISEQAPPLLRGRFVFEDLAPGQETKYYVNLWTTLLPLQRPMLMRRVMGTPEVEARIDHVRSSVIANQAKELQECNDLGIAQLGEELAELLAEIEGAVHGRAGFYEHSDPLPHPDAASYLAAVQRAYPSKTLPADQERLNQLWQQATEVAEKLREKEAALMD